MPKRVPLAPIQRAVRRFLSKGHTYTDICIRLDWITPQSRKTKKPRADIKKLKRCLGLDYIHSTNKGKEKNHKYKYKNKTISPKIAIEIIRAIDRDPVEFDL